MLLTPAHRLIFDGERHSCDQCQSSAAGQPEKFRRRAGGASESRHERIGIENNSHCTRISHRL
jgi:hypothetical protein